MPRYNVGEFTGKCDCCKRVKPRRATIFRALSNTKNIWSHDPESRCFDCRVKTKPHYRLHEKHGSRRSKIKAKLRDAARLLSGHY